MSRLFKRRNGRRRERYKPAIVGIPVGVVIVAVAGFVGSQNLGAAGLLWCLAFVIDLLRGWAEQGGIDKRERLNS